MARIWFVLFFATLGCDKYFTPTHPVEIREGYNGEFVSLKTTPEGMLFIREFPDDSVLVEYLGELTPGNQPYQGLSIGKEETLKIKLSGELPLHVSSGPSGETFIVGEWLGIRLPGGEKILFKVITQTLIIKFE
jgi:hypothetical protein